MAAAEVGQGDNPGNRFSNKVALVTGGSRGIGKAIARALVDGGARVVISSRKQADLDLVAAELGESALALAAHAGDPDQIRGCVERAVEAFGPIDVLVNNAATNPHMGRMIDVDLGRWDKTFEVNLRGPLIWIQEALRLGMGSQRQASVINIASIGGLSFGGAIGVYDTSKAALIHMTKHLATELGPSVRINAVAPGLVRTDFARALWDNPASEGFVKRWPMRRFGEPEDIASAVGFLASDEASWVTGEVMVVDGGAVLGGFGM